MERLAVLWLVSGGYSADAIGQQLPGEEVQRKVFATLSSISQGEWFEAGRNGHKPKVKAAVFAHNYQNETEAILNGQRYSIYRTFLNDKNEEVELYLEEKAGV